MSLDYLKELQPVVYDDSCVKVLSESSKIKGEICFPDHWHDRLEILRITKGQLKLKISNQEVLACENEVVILNPKQVHSGFAGENGVSYFGIMFEITPFKNNTVVLKNLINSIENLNIYFENIISNKEIVQILDTILKLKETKSQISSLSVISKIYELLGLLFENCAHEYQSIKIASGEFSEIIDYINLNFAKRISSKTISEKFNYNESYFCRNFKKITGLTPTNYIKILRLEKAISLLNQGEFSVKEVANNCGFDDMGYFTKCFKKHFEFTPTQYKSLK